MKTVLAISATDSCGGAGLAADLRAIAACGLHAAFAVTAVTAQRTTAVDAVYPLPPSMVHSQLASVFGDMDVAAVKSGVLGAAVTIATVRDSLASRQLPYVLDPVAVASSGGLLAPAGTFEAAAVHLFPLAALITPNADEAAALTGTTILTREDAARAGKTLLRSGCGAVLVKGGHLAEDEAVDVLVTAAGVRCFTGQRHTNPNRHGTGCTLASAIAANLALGHPLADAVGRAREFVAGAIAAGYRIGGGPGPVDQLWGSRQALMGLAAGQGGPR